MKRFYIILILLFSLLQLNQIYAAVNNAGFIPSNIWYSKDPFEDGDKIKIYTLIFNPDDRELSGTVVFYDKTVLLGKKSFAVAPKGVKDVSIDWTVSAGDHTIFATIENAKFLISPGKYEDAVISENKTAESTHSVSKKIVTKANTSNNDTTIGQIQNIQNIIAGNTPDFIAKPMVLGAETVEGLRSSAGTASENKAQELKKEIKAFDNKKASSKNTNNNDKIMKPWTYVEYFFMTFLSFILNNKIIFYSLLAILVFLLLRFIWRKIF